MTLNGEMNGILNYECDIVVKRFTFAISHLLMSACVHYLHVRDESDDALGLLLVTSLEPADC